MNIFMAIVGTLMILASVGASYYLGFITPVVLEEDENPIYFPVTIIFILCDLVTGIILIAKVI